MAWLPSGTVSSTARLQRPVSTPNASPNWSVNSAYGMVKRAVGALAQRHRPGSRWRFLAWRRNDGEVAASSVEHPDAVFDELVVDHWFHLEQMDRRVWWAAITREDGSRVVLWVRVGARGRARRVDVHEEPA